MSVRRVARFTAIAVLTIGGALMLPRGVAAHALLQSSDPAAGSSVAAAPAAVVMTFGEAPDPKLSSAQVLDSAGRNVASGPAAAVPGHPEQLQVPLGSLPDGVYTVAWRTVSTVDGHTVAGSFAFGVGVSPGSAATGTSATTVTSSSASPAATITRFLLYAGLILLFGAGLFGSIIQPRPPRRILALAVVAWIVAVAGTIGLIAVQALDTGAGFRYLPRQWRGARGPDAACRDRGRRVGGRRPGGHPQTPRPLGPWRGRRRRRGGHARRRAQRPRQRERCER